MSLRFTFNPEQHLCNELSAESAKLADMAEIAEHLAPGKVISVRISVVIKFVF